MIELEALETFTGYHGGSIFFNDGLVSEAIRSEFRVGMVVVRGCLPVWLPIRVFRRHGVTTIILEHPVMSSVVLTYGAANVQQLEQLYVGHFYAEWAWSFGRALIVQRSCFARLQKSILWWRYVINFDTKCSRWDGAFDESIVETICDSHLLTLTLQNRGPMHRK